MDRDLDRLCQFLDCLYAKLLDCVSLDFLSHLRSILIAAFLFNCTYDPSQRGWWGLLHVNCMTSVGEGFNQLKLLCMVSF